MRLYKLKTQFYGKDLNEETLLGFVVAEDDEQVFDHMNEKFMYGSWPDSVQLTREAIVAKKGDFETEYMGEFYDQKFGWEDMGEISGKDIECLKALKILD